MGPTQFVRTRIVGFDLPTQSLASGRGWGCLPRLHHMRFISHDGPRSSRTIPIMCACVAPLSLFLLPGQSNPTHNHNQPHTTPTQVLPGETEEARTRVAFASHQPASQPAQPSQSMSGPLKLTAKEFVPSGAGKRVPSYPVVDRFEGPY